MPPTNPKPFSQLPDLKKGLDEIRKAIGDVPEFQYILELVDIGQRLEKEEPFTKSDAAEIADKLLDRRSPRDALDFLERVAERGPRTMLHRAVVGEINARARVGCG